MQEWIFREIQQVDATDFRFKEKDVRSRRLPTPPLRCTTRSAVDVLLFFCLFHTGTVYLCEQAGRADAALPSPSRHRRPLPPRAIRSRAHYQLVEPPQPVEHAVRISLSLFVCVCRGVSHRVCCVCVWSLASRAVRSSHAYRTVVMAQQNPPGLQGFRRRGEREGGVVRNRILQGAPRARAPRQGAPRVSQLRSTCGSRAAANLPPLSSCGLCSGPRCSPAPTCISRP